MMVIFVITVSISVILLGLYLLYREGLIKSGVSLAVSLLLMSAAVLIRVYLFDYESGDYKDFLAAWVEFFRQNGGIRGLGIEIGNYNPPYLYFLALFSYIGIDDLYLIKLLSVIFDVLLAWACMKLASLFVSGTRLTVCFFAVLFLPTVVINGACWGQCDSIYTFFAVWSIYLALSDRPAASMFTAAASLAFKLQAVFFLPLYFVLLLSGKIKLKQLFIFPAAYTLYILPAVIAGRPFFDTLFLYTSQAESVGAAMNYNAPSLTSVFSWQGDTVMWSKILIAAAFMYLFILFAIALANRRRLDNRAFFAFAILMVIGIPYLLPHMHDRYFYTAGLLLLVLAVSEPKYLPAVCFAELASLHCYYAYFMRYYLFHPKYNGLLMLAALVISGIYFVSALKKTKKT